MIKFAVKGDLKRTSTYLEKVKNEDIIMGVLNRYGRVGVELLSASTPFDTGETSRGWSYKTGRKGGIFYIHFLNSKILNGTPLVVMLQYGHGTGTGGWVAGRDFINPAIQPLFDVIRDEVVREVRSL